MRDNSFIASLNKHFVNIGVGMTGVAVLGGAHHNAEAALVYSGVVNIVVPSTTAGVYLNVVTGVNSSIPSGAPGWDINPWGTSSLSVWTNNSTNPPNTDGTVVDYAGGSSATLTDNLPFFTTVGPTFAYARTAGIETVGATAFNFNSDINLIGYRFYNEQTSAVNYGFARISLSSSIAAQPRLIIDYVYEDSGQPISLVPEPAALGVLAAGAVGLMIRRRQ